MHWLQLQFTPCEALPSVWIGFAWQYSQACGHPCCLCTFSYPISSFQSTLYLIYFDTALLEQPPLSVMTLCDLPSVWRVSMIVFWTISNSAVFPILVVSKNKRYPEFILYVSRIKPLWLPSNATRGNRYLSINLHELPFPLFPAPMANHRHICFSLTRVHLSCSPHHLIAKSCLAMQTFPTVYPVYDLDCLLDSDSLPPDYSDSTLLSDYPKCSPPPELWLWFCSIYVVLDARDWTLPV